MIKDKRTYIEAPILTDPEDESCATYTPVIKDMITTKQAIDRINSRTSRRIKPDAFYHRVTRGRIKAVKVGNKYFFHPHDIDRLSFTPKARKNLYASIEPVQVHTIEDLKKLERKYGRLVDINGMVEELEKETERRFGITYSYTVGAIKQRIHRGTIYYVAFTGSEKRRQHWFPVKQIEHMHLQPYKRRKSEAS